MDIGALASSLTTALVPLLPYLLKAGDKAAENRQNNRRPELGMGQVALDQTEAQGRSQRSCTKPHRIQRRCRTTTICALLVTSREAITLPKMTSLTLNPLSEKEAREPLLEIPPRAQPAAEQICELCGYLPLAIRAAGSLLAITPDLDPLDYADQLKDERNRLEHIRTKGVEIDVAASFNLSYSRLPPEAARVFRLLFVFPGTVFCAFLCYGLTPTRTTLLVLPFTVIRILRSPATVMPLGSLTFNCVNS